MPFHIRKAVQDDVPALYSVYSSAFSDTIIGRQIFPENSEAGRLFWLESLPKEIDDLHAHMLVVTESTPGEPDTVVAFAKWLVPGAPYEELPLLEIWPQDGNPALAVEFFSALNAAHQGTMGDTQHWYLELIAVRKESMGKGAASPLLRWGVERADAEGLPCFLEATPNGRGMYEKYGFRVVGEDEFVSPEGKVLEYYMIRDSKAE
ncbi:hypothetical protein G7046_g1827 [Stylonectria norvegica]|nr:hypothetical protein G7046_g1827 [Stylonectria norvegica]